MTASCLLHIGYMKSATTYLQESVFNNPMTGFAIPLGGSGRAFIVDQIILSDGFTFDKNAVAARLEAAGKPVRDRNLIPVWSDETFLGEPISRRYDAHTNALRLHAVLPDAKVLITIREQKALAYSMYVEYVRQGGLAALTEFIGTGQEKLSFSPFLRLDHLLFDRAVAFYQDLFGPDRVLVLPQELLARNRAAYFEKLSTFVGREIEVPLNAQTRVHSSLGASANRVRRTLNRLKSPRISSNAPGRWERGLEKGLKVLDRVTPDILDQAASRSLKMHIEERYAGLLQDSNARLSTLIDLDLSDYGYD